jgi:hypothetical protein
MVGQFSILDVRISVDDNLGTTLIFPYKEIGQSDRTMRFVLSKPVYYDEDDTKFYTFARACK